MRAKSKNSRLLPGQHDGPRHETASAAHEPHRLAFYLYELASELHAHWNRGKDRPQLRIVNSAERDLSNARVALVVCLIGVLASGLRILGVGAPDEMR